MASPAVKRLLLTCWRALPVGLRSRALVLLAGRGLPRTAGRPPVDGPVYVAGHLTAATGLGQSARLYYEQARAAGCAVHAVDLTEKLLQQPVQGIFAHRTLSPAELHAHTGPGTLVIHVNPPVFMLALRHLRPLLPGKRIVAYWAWELMDIPGFWRPCLAYADAVEAPSSFTAAAIRPHTAKPVTVHPHAVPQAQPGTRRFAEDGIVRVLTMFDMASNFHRKNPLAAVRAFQLAFGHDPRARLLIKTSSVDRYPPGKEALLAATRGWENITVHDERLRPDELAALYYGHDVALSLHRSEGYGLTIAEALRHGLHAVATGWSGNMDFMRQGEKCHPIPYGMVPVEDAQGGMSVPGQSWAEADTTAAAACLRGIAQRERPDLDFPAPPDYSPPRPRLHPGNVGVVLVNFQGWPDTLAALEALVALQPGRILVVDNGSQDDSAQRLLSGWEVQNRQAGRAAPARCDAGGPDPGGDLLMALKENRGFAGGNNAALRPLLEDDGCQAFWLLNNDALPEPEALDALCQRLNARTDAGMCGSLLVCAHAPDSVQCAGGGTLSRWTGVTRDLYRGASAKQAQTLLPEAVEQDLAFLTAASLLIRREALEGIGLLSEDYFLYYEDTDLSLRMRRGGYALAFAPQSVVLHREGASTGQLRPLVDYLSLRNRLLFMRRHYPGRLGFAVARHLGTLAKRLLAGDLAGAKRVVQALLDWHGQAGRGERA